MSTAPAAAWFPDPSDPSQLRWWDGSTWTEHVHPIIAQAQPAASEVMYPGAAVPRAVEPAGPQEPTTGGEPTHVGRDVDAEITELMAVERCHNQRSNSRLEAWGDQARGPFGFGSSWEDGGFRPRWSLGTMVFSAIWGFLFRR